MAFTLNGFGTRYQGTRWLPDGTYITTKWFVLMWVPLIPLGSSRVLDVTAAWAGVGYSGRHMTVQPVPLDLWMVLRTYVAVVSGFGAIIGMRWFADWINLSKILF
jgi:hypothetical protein